jgi:hypothetical protein
MKRSWKEVSDLRRHGFKLEIGETYDQYDKLEKMLTEFNIVQVTQKCRKEVWNVSPATNYLFSCFNRFGFNFLDGKFQFNLHFPLFSSSQLKKLELFPKQVLVFNVSIFNINSALQAVEHYFAVKETLKRFCYPLQDYIIQYVGCDCATFDQVEEEVMESHNIVIRAKQERKLKQQKMEQLARQFL